MKRNLILLLGFIVVAVLVWSIFLKPKQDTPEYNYEKLDINNIKFFTQIKPQETFMQALISNDREGLVVDDNGCLRINGYLIIWPYGYSIKKIDGIPIIFDSEGIPKLKFGDKISIGGGECANCPSDYIESIISERAYESCEGDFWIVGEIIN